MAAHEPVAVGQPPDRPAGRAGLVRDLPHDLLDDVLERDDPGRAAVLVDHDGKLGPFALQVGQQVVERLGLGHDRRLPDRPLEVGIGALGHHQLDQLVDVDDPLDPILVLVLGHHQA